MSAEAWNPREGCALPSPKGEVGEAGTGDDLARAHFHGPVPRITFEPRARLRLAAPLGGSEQPPVPPTSLRSWEGQKTDPIRSAQPFNARTPSQWCSPATPPVMSHGVRPQANPQPVAAPSGGCRGVAPLHNQAAAVLPATTPRHEPWGETAGKLPTGGRAFRGVPGGRPPAQSGSPPHIRSVFAPQPSGRVRCGWRVGVCGGRWTRGFRRS